MNRTIKFSAAVSLMAIFAFAPTGAQAADIYYVKNISYKDVLAYDRQATLQCIQGSLPAKPTARVVFVADHNQTFGWTPRNPDYYFINVGWANCKAFRKVQSGD